MHYKQYLTFSVVREVYWYGVCGCHGDGSQPLVDYLSQHHDTQTLTTLKVKKIERYFSFYPAIFRSDTL